MFPSRLTFGLLAELYALTMLAGQVQNPFKVHVTFGLFVCPLSRNRKSPAGAGLKRAIDFLENVPFSPEEDTYFRTVSNNRRIVISRLQNEYSK